MQTPTLSSETKAYAAGVGFTLIFCLHYLAASRLLADLPPVVLGAWRGLLGGGVLAVAFRSHWKSLFTAKVGVRAVAMGVFGFCLNQILLLEGLKRSAVADAAVITNCLPLVSTVFAWLIRKEAITRRQGLGLLLGFAALAAYFVAQKGFNLGDHVLGNALILLNVCSLAVALVIGKGLLQTVHEGAVTAAMLCSGGLILGFAAGPDLWAKVAPLSEDPTKLALLGFEVFVVTIGGYLLNLYALKRLPVAAAMSMSYLQPPVTATLGFFLLGQTADPLILPLFATVIASTWLVRPR